MIAQRDRYGFSFWLGWILKFVGSFVAAILFWTFSITALFGKIQGVELSTTWAMAVFGSWFILMVPFMKKKEQIWKRLNDDQEKAVDAWLLGLRIFVGLLIITAAFWSFIYRNAINTSTQQGVNGLWLKAVIGSWLFLMLPFLVFMYLKADAIFKAAVKRQTQTGPFFKSCFIEKTNRILPNHISSKLKSTPPILDQGHIGHLKLKGGRIIENVFIMNSAEVLGLYDREIMDFEMNDVEDIELINSESLPPYREESWLRLDGRAS